jgi:hypothetical protein
MLRILRQLTPDELRQVAHHSGARPGATPDEVVRSLARLCNASLWGIFPAVTDDVLLDQLGRQLGMTPMVGGPRALLLREQAILAIYLRHAWEAASPDDRRALMRRLPSFWDTQMVPFPAVPEEPLDDEATRMAIQPFLASSAGCRALALAVEERPLPLPMTLPAGGSVPAILLGPNRRQMGHQAMYAVLQITWRARSRLLREHRLLRMNLERQARQLESLLAVRRRSLRADRKAWALNPASGLSVAAAGGASLAVHGVLAVAAPAVIAPAATLVGVGLMWSLTAAALRPRAVSDRRAQTMSQQIAALRQQIARVDRDIMDFEAEWPVPAWSYAAPAAPGVPHL